MAIKLFVAKSTGMFNRFVNVVKAMKDSAGVCVLFTRPYKTVRGALGDSSKSVLFVDTLGDAQERNVLHASAEDLTSLSIMIHQALQALPKEKHSVILDSISTLTMHNHPSVVSKFVRFVVSQLNALNADGIFIVARDAIDANLLTTIEQVADEVIEN